MKIINDFFFKQEPVEKKERLNFDNSSGVDSDSDDDSDIEDAAFDEHDSHIDKPVGRRNGQFFSHHRYTRSLYRYHYPYKLFDRIDN